METNNYIQIKKGSKVFIACNDYFGFFGSGIYKMWNVKNGENSHYGETFALNFKEAVNMLHEYIQENEYMIKEYPKTKYSIYMIDGTMNKYGEVNFKEVYSITTAKAKKLLF